MTETWPFLALAGLGLFHGLNPAMGWLFAVALGMHRRSERVVLLSLVPIAFGHMAAVGATLLATLALGLVFDQAAIVRTAGVLLLAWAGWHAAYGHRRPVRIGMRTGQIGLALWSFLVAGAHGAGLMLIPVALPLCLSSSGKDDLGNASLAGLLAALGTHTAAMLTAIAVVSLVVYRWSDLAFLRRWWINFDLIWILALIASGSTLLATA